MNENTKLKEDFANEGMYREIIEETGPDNTYMRRDGYSSLSITENRHYAVCWFKGKMLERIIDNRMRNF